MQEQGQRIDLVVVLCGLNDFKHAYTSWRRTASGFRHELRELVAAIQQEAGVDCTVVLPAIPVQHAPVFSGVWPLQPLLAHLAGLWDEQKEALHDHARRIAFVRNASDPGGYATPDYWAVDGIHPNDEGYRLWGEHIAQAIVRQALLGAATAP